MGSNQTSSVPLATPERVLAARTSKLLLSYAFIYTTYLLQIDTKMSVSRIRQNYHEDAEALVNKQINMEFYASYVYLSMASYFLEMSKPFMDSPPSLGSNQMRREHME